MQEPIIASAITPAFELTQIFIAYHVPGTFALPML